MATKLFLARSASNHVGVLQVGLIQVALLSERAAQQKNVIGQVKRNSVKIGHALEKKKVIG